MLNYRRIKNMRARLENAQYLGNKDNDIAFWDAVYWFWANKIKKEYDLA